MTEKQIAQWIKVNLGPIIQKALSQRPGKIYTEEWLGAMVQREVGFLIARYVEQNAKFDAICSLMRGDYSQRTGETEKQYHGFGFFQIDVASFPDFVKSGAWKDPLKTCLKAIDVLEAKRKYLETKSEYQELTNDQKCRAITAAYNTGEGNAFKSILAKRDVDFTTHNKDYSKEVWRFKDIYKSV
ncbi:hypothetical protein [Pinibacter soli]|uniref:Transglycosylase SLT domain-containing protein n=1 Tax=Pinibacter soli TaxID=3044211 RepID=A0ABT6RBQ7_9BACT|nr:hypothetical protein [Pinibacter soli]MDI3320013.1 hypothetical protein [Pinibacter soli]